MNDTLMILLKISLVIFMAGNLLDMGLKLNPQDDSAGLRNVRFVAHTLVWGFVLCPALAYVIPMVVRLEQPYAIGLILMGMTPCAPLLPAIAMKPFEADNIGARLLEA
jgi:bile acid:Na+ symporter, BASS family